MAGLDQKSMDELIDRYQRRLGAFHYSPRYTTKSVKIPNPELEGLDDIDRAIAIRGGKKPEVDINVAVARWENPNGFIEAYQDPITQEYIVSNERLDATPTLPRKETPEQDAAKEAAAAEDRRAAQWQRDNGPDSINPQTGTTYRESGTQAPGSGRYESHIERAKREHDERVAARGEAAEGRAVRDQEIQEETRLQAAQTAERDRVQKEREFNINSARTQEQLAIQRAQDIRAQQQFEYSQQKDAETAARLDRPQVQGTPSDTSRNVAVWDPVSQTMRSVENPIYDEAKVNAARLKDQLSTAIALNQMSAQQAAQQYKQWWDTNVELPFKQAQEQRARAAEQRAALEAEDRRKQFASDFSLRSSDLGFRAGNAAVQNEISLLPYRAGPEAGEQFSSAFNSLAQGGKVDGPDASAGINFTAEAFEFDRPDFEGIAQKATKNALKGLTKYSPEGKFSQADYSGVATPTGAGAPGAGPMIDTSALWQQYASNGVPAYTGPEEEE